MGGKDTGKEVRLAKEDVKVEGWRGAAITFTLIKHPTIISAIIVIVVEV